MTPNNVMVAMGWFLTWVFALCAVAVYLVPSYIASATKNTDAAKIFWINLLLGWTVVGWLVAMYMANKD